MPLHKQDKKRNPKYKPDSQNFKGLSNMFRCRTKPLRSSISYMVISHCWADGYFANGMVAACVLEHIIELANQFQCTDVWIDCLCLSKVGIEKIDEVRLLTIAEVYQGATAGVLFASEMINGEEVHIENTRWNTRLWTQQEGYLTRNMVIVGSMKDEEAQPLQIQYPTTMHEWCQRLVGKVCKQNMDYWKCLQSILGIYDFNFWKNLDFHYMNSWYILDSYQLKQQFHNYIQRVIMKECV